MTHYQQIIINLAVEDDTPQEEIEKFRDIIVEFIEKNKDCRYIKEIGTRIN